eukprot:s10_g20.t1
MRGCTPCEVLAVEYPGYGICPGSCDEAGIMANAHAAFHFATETLKWPKDAQLLPYQWIGCEIRDFVTSDCRFAASNGGCVVSKRCGAGPACSTLLPEGTGPTVQLAAKAEVAGVILISPFTSIRELFRGQIGQMADFLENRFPNLELTPKIRSPTLIIHGLQDSLISPDHGRKIYASIGCKRMIDAATFILPMTHFFSLPDYSFEELSLPSWVFPADVDLQPKQRYDLEWFPPMCTHGCIHPRNKEDAVVEPISRLKACHGSPEDAEAEVHVALPLPMDGAGSTASNLGEAADGTMMPTICGTPSVMFVTPPSDTDHDWTDASGISAVPTDLRPAAQAHERFGVHGQCLFVVRPDHHVGFRCEPIRAGAVWRYFRQACGISHGKKEDAPASTAVFDPLPAFVWGCILLLILWYFF